MDIAQSKKTYEKKIAPVLKEQFHYSSTTEVPVLRKIVISQGFGNVTEDKRIIDVAVNEISSTTGQKAVTAYSKKDTVNFKLRRKMPIDVMITLRHERAYEFLEKLVRVTLPRIHDFRGIENKFDGRGDYTLGIEGQIVFPEINIDAIDRIQGMSITLATSVETDEEGYALFKGFGLPLKNVKNG